MTVSTLNNRASYAGNGVTTAFSFPNKFLADADLVVYEVVGATDVATLKVLTTHYTVTGAGADAGGTVTMLVATPAGTTLVILRDPALTQPIDLVNGDPLNVETGVEKAFDRSTLQIQRLRDLSDRSLRFNDADTSGADPELPIPMAGTLVGWNSTGTALVNSVPADLALAVVSPFIETVVDDASAAIVTETLRGNLSEMAAQPADNDEVILRDTSATGGVRMTVANFIKAVLDTARTFTANHIFSGTATFSGAVTMLAKALWFAEGATVASAADCNIWTTDGNTVHVTGTTGISDWGTAPQAGAWKRIIFDGALVLTHHATTNDMPGAASRTTVAGDSCIVYANSASSYKILSYVPYAYIPGLAVDVQTFSAAGAGTWTKPAGYPTAARVRMRLWAGGGSGGSANVAGAPGGGGGGGGFKEVWKALSEMGATESTSVGAGGAAVTGNSHGLSGGNTTVGSLATAYSGAGGRGTTFGNGGGGGGGGGFTAAGSAGVTVTGGAGGAPTWSTLNFAGGTGGNAADPPTAGTSSVFGGGGGGGADTVGSNTVGVGGDSIWGGGGGGGAGEATAGAAGGSSQFGGAGGAGATSGGTATSGTQPSGGGGGAENGTSGAGGAGYIEIVVFP